MRNWRRLVLLAVVLCWWGGSARVALAWVTCWCEIDTVGSDGKRTSQQDLTAAVNHEYNGCLEPKWNDFTEQCSKNISNCSERCNAACDGYVRSQSLADSLCAKGVANGTDVKCYSHVGTLTTWQVNQSLGKLTNVPAVTNTVCTCPKPWFNNKDVLGGPTSGDKQCKIQVCAPITPGPGSSLPPNGTATNTWPTQWWTWENTLWQWAPVATCVTTQVSPAKCTLQ